MRNWKVTIFALVLAALFGCENGSDVASTPNQLPYDCYAYGNCGANFPYGTFNNGYQNFAPYGIATGQSPYVNGGLTGCAGNQYPIFYPNIGYACANHSAFTAGANYGIWNYQPTSYEFQAASGFAFPNYYNYNYNYAFQGCTFSGACNCQGLNGVPPNYGVCANGSHFNQPAYYY